MPDEPLVWLRSEVKTPPFAAPARIETSVLPRRLQRGEMLALPHSRAMPSIGARCHGLRVPDREATWRIVYRVDRDAIVIADVFSKKTRQTPRAVLARCQQRLHAYDEATR